MTTTSTDPSWLAARRERAAAASAELALPDATVPGWEFTDLGGLDLDAFPPAPAETAGGDAVFDDVAVPDGVTAMPLAQAVAERPELVERHLGSVVSQRGRSVRRAATTPSGPAGCSCMSAPAWSPTGPWSRARSRLPPSAAPTGAR